MTEEPAKPGITSRYPLLISAFFFVLGAASGGWGMHELHERQNRIRSDFAESITQFREESGDYRFIQPLLYCRLPESTILGEKEDLKKAITKRLEEISRKHADFEGAVYYRDLDRGRWIGINEEKRYTPASLLKVVIMMTYLKLAETDPQILDTTLPFTQSHADLLSRSPLDRGTALTVGETYTIKELVETMIIHSDNGATFALLGSLEKTVLNQVYRDLGLRNPDDMKHAYTINAREYSYFLRILYNATYVERALSEYALELLSRTTFQEGLKRGVPTTTPVSHKYGESISQSGAETGILELHDCGIIYHEKNPYLLCIMTRGKKLETLLEAIRSISKIVYDDVVQED